MEAMFLIEKHHLLRSEIAGLEAELKESESLFERLESEGQVGIVLYRNWTIQVRKIFQGSSSCPNSSQLSVSKPNTKIFTENQAIVFCVWTCFEKRATLLPSSRNRPSSMAPFRWRSWSKKWPFWLKNRRRMWTVAVWHCWSSVFYPKCRAEAENVEKWAKDT